MIEIIVLLLVATIVTIVFIIVYRVTKWLVNGVKCLIKYINKYVKIS